MRELGGTTCRCGRAKKARQTFCSRCFFNLAPPLRAALYRRVGEGYEEAYAAAVAALDGKQEAARA